MAKVSFITTVLNEEDSILEFLESYSRQTKKADEVIIVDGGSIDLTTKLISRFVKDNKKLNIKLLKKKGNRSIGRNTAISRTKYEIIACSDVGCIFDENWLKEITAPFNKDKNLGVVAAFYLPKTNSVFEKCLATYTCVMKDKVDKKKFLPSSRSIAFRKEAWEKVGGYSKELDTCEDLVFAKKLKQRGVRFKFTDKAFVYWPQEKGLKKATKQFYEYAKGDGRALYFRPQTPLLFARYMMGLSLFLLFFIYWSPLFLLYFILGFLFYIVWIIDKNYRYVEDFRGYLYLPLLQFASDIAVMAGMVVGVKKRLIE